MSEVITHKCSNCDGPLMFDPTTQNFHCEYCLSVFSEADIAAFEQKIDGVTDSVTAPQVESSFDDERFSEEISPDSEPFSTDAPSQDDSIEMDLFNCPSCGAEIVTEPTTAATYCYYCHNPVVVAGRVSGKFLPESVLPFAIEKKEAVSQFLTWARKKKFIPKDFFEEQQVEKLTGVYFPYWIVDAELNGSLSASANSVSVWRSGNYEYTQTKKYRLYREGDMRFTDLVKNALQKNAKVKMVESVQPFPLDKSVPFKSQYLAGFQAEKRDLEYQTLKADIENEMKHYGKSILEDTIAGYSTVYNRQVNLDIKNQHQQYVLLPVWLVTYRNEQATDDSNKLYYFAMNGQTGKVSGKLPIAKGKLLGFSLGVSLLVLILFLIGGYFI